MIVVLFSLFTLLKSQAEQRFAITSPPSLKERFENGIPYQIGNYGYIPYGQTLYGIVETSTDEDGCILTSTRHHNPHYLKFLLVTKGNCSYAQKTLNAQNEGYKMLIIVDNFEEELNVYDLKNLNHTIEIDIPAIMITKHDGAKLKNYFLLENQQKVFLKIHFQEPIKQEIVQYQYWMSPMDIESNLFIEQFKPFHELMSDNLDFTPHYALWQNPSCKKQDWKVKSSQCVSGGRYCAADPDLQGPLTGQDAVMQALLEICIFRNNKLDWWNYVYFYSKTCLRDLEIIDNELCSLRIMKEMNLEVETLQKCVQNSFIGPDVELDDNKLLSEEQELFQQQGIQTWPWLIINGAHYIGDLILPVQKSEDGRELFNSEYYGPLQMICSAFIKEKLPEICRERIIGYLEGDKIKIHKNVNSHTWIWVITIISFVLGLGVIFYFMRRNFRIQQKSDLQLQVNMEFSQYYALSEKEKSQSKQ